uniref:Uncharacterized protein n=1 Tax=viral metagenome TaxID=1070528 RepID=A0A6C0H223_9ZZZZ
MASLYYVPLNRRLRTYYNEVAEKQIDINNDYVLNQQLLFDERMQRNAFTTFENQKKIIEKQKTESKNLNAKEFQKKLYLENPEIYYLPPSEKSKTLAIEQPEIFALPPSTRKALEIEQEGKPKGGTPRGSPITKISSRKPDGELTPFGQLAEDAKIRVYLKGDPIYEKIRESTRATTGSTVGLPIKRELQNIAEQNNLEFDKTANVKKNIDIMLKSLYKKKLEEGTIKGEGFIKKNKYLKYRKTRY